MSRTPKVTTHLSTKGRVILPKAVRDRLNWSPGSKLVVEARGSHVVLRRAPTFEVADPARVFGCLKVTASLTLGEMDEATRVGRTR